MQVDGSEGWSKKKGVDEPGGCLECNAAAVSGVSGASVSLEKRRREAPLRSPSCIFSSTFLKRSYLFLPDLVYGLGENMDEVWMLFLIFWVSETLLSLFSET